MKRVFLDTNIMLDYALGREHADDAEQLLQRGYNGTVSLQASYLTFAKVAACDVIVTNNVKDFAEFSDLPVMTAAGFLSEQE